MGTTTQAGNPRAHIVKRTVFGASVSAFCIAGLSAAVAGGQGPGQPAKTQALVCCVNSTGACQVLSDCPNSARQVACPCGDPY